MINIFLLERQKIVREGLKVLLNEEDDFEVFISENKDVKISQINYLKPDIIVVSLDNMDENDFSYLDIFLDTNRNLYQLKHLNPVKIIVYASKVNEFILNKALEIGCAGYLLKESSIEELKQAIRSVYNGYKHIGNSVFSQIKQLFVASGAIAVAEKNHITSHESYRNGLLTTDSIGSEELDFENFKIDNLKNVTQSEKTLDYPKILPQAKSKNWFYNLSSTILLISLGCTAAIVGVFYLSDRANKSFQPITKYGIVQGDTIAIKSPDSGKIKQYYHQVGDLVKANEVVAEIEPLFIEQKQQNIVESTRKIEETVKELNTEKQLLINLKSQVVEEQQKIQQLLVKSTAQPNNLSEQNKLKDQLQASSKKLQSQVEVALANYQKLQKLNQQKIVSQLELKRAEQIWKSLENKLIQNQNSQSFNSTDFLTINQQAENRFQLKQLEKKIKQLQTKVSKRKKTIEILKEKLNNFQVHLYNLENSDYQQQLIDIKAPFKGVVYQINRNNNQQIDKDKTIVKLLDCQHLWIEVMLNSDHLREIDFQQPVVFHLKDYQHNLIGKVASVESLSKFNQTQPNFLYYETSVLNTYLQENALDRKMLFKIKIDFPSLENYVHDQKFCNIGKKGLVTFNN